MKFYADFITSAPEELNVSFAFLVVPPGEPFPEHLRNTNMCAAVVCYVGPMNKAQEVVRPLKEFGPPAFDGTGPVPYPMLQGELLQRAHHFLPLVHRPYIPNHFRAHN